MTTRLLARVLVISVLLGSVPALWAQDQTVDQSLGILNENVNRLKSQVEDLQVRNQQLQKTVDSMQTELQQLRQVAGAGSGVSQSDLKALDDRIQAVDNARQKDRQVIIDQLAKELAGTNPGKSSGKFTPPATDGKDYVVVKGDTLSSIGKKYKVSVEDLKKTNNLSGNDINVGQKLTIPK